MEWPFLEALGEEEARLVLARTRRRQFARGDLVFCEGDPADTLYLIDDGHAAVRVTTLAGDTAMIRVLGPGHHFGELAIVSPGPRNASIAALDTLSVRALHRDDYETLRRENPGLQSVLVEALVAEIRRLTTRLTEAYYLPVPRRLAACLLELADLYAPGGDGAVDLPFTQEDLAQLVGIARPTANRELGALQDRGLVAMGRGRITVADREALRRA